MTQNEYNETNLIAKLDSLLAEISILEETRMASNKLDYALSCLSEEIGEHANDLDWLSRLSLDLEYLLTIVRLCSVNLTSEEIVH